VRHVGFTLVEVIAVVALLALLAGATALSLTGDADLAKHSDILDRLRHADRMARLAAQRTGRPQLLRINLDKQRIQRMQDTRGGQDTANHPYALPAGYRIAAVVMPDTPDAPGYARTNADVDEVDTSIAEIAFSTEGRSVSYAVRIVSTREAAPDEAPNHDRPREWLVVSGLTGQATLHDDQTQIDNLFDALTARRPDAG